MYVKYLLHYLNKYATIIPVKREAPENGAFLVAK